jgi:hypothetical protein
VVLRRSDDTLVRDPSAATAQGLPSNQIERRIQGFILRFRFSFYQNP